MMLKAHPICWMLAAAVLAAPMAAAQQGAPGEAALLLPLE